LIVAVLAFRHFGEGYAILLLAIGSPSDSFSAAWRQQYRPSCDPRLPGRGWAIFFGVITIIAGIIVLAYPLDSIITLTLVVGIWLIIIGLFEIISAFGLRSDGKKLKEAVSA
jgi:uncharacterized membrane protein HdeD (DUF308 family)